MEGQKPDPRAKTLALELGITTGLAATAPAAEEEEPSKEGFEAGKVKEMEPKGNLSATAAKAAKEAAAGLVTDLQKKLLRAERFGVPVNLSEQEKRNTRAER